MAEQATQEPSMEEILSTIRRIISEDGDEEAKPNNDAGAPVIAQNDETDSLDDLLSASTPEPTATVDAPAEPAGESIDDILDLEDFQLDKPAAIEPSPVSEQEPAVETPIVQTPEIETPVTATAEVLPEPSIDEAPELVEPTPIVATPAPAPEPVLRPEPVETTMTTTARYDETVLTEEATADKAAGALGRLIAGMDLGGENTIEGLVREMLKPMIKEWLDANLPQIVEDKVEAEVQRIAKMVR